MKVFALRNDEGYYVSMSGGQTKNWFEASKFPEEDVEKRMKYADEEFKLISFVVQETSSEE